MAHGGRESTAALGAALKNSGQYALQTVPVFDAITGKITGYAVIAMQDRGTLCVSVGDEVYEGSVIGENKRAEDLDVNAVRERKVTNIRSATSEELVKIVPPREMTLDQALEFIADDECVEVTPQNVRLRKNILNTNERQKAQKQKKRGDAPKG